MRLRLRLNRMRHAFMGGGFGSGSSMGGVSGVGLLSGGGSFSGSGGGISGSGVMWAYFVFIAYSCKRKLPTD